MDVSARGGGSYGVKNKFKVPEGRWTLHFEHAFGAVPFSHQRCTRLTLARLAHDAGPDEAGPWLIYNVGDYLYVYKADSQRKVSPSNACACIGCFT